MIQQMPIHEVSILKHPVMSLRPFQKEILKNFQIFSFSMLFPIDFYAFSIDSILTECNYKSTECKITPIHSG